MNTYILHSTIILVSACLLFSCEKADTREGNFLLSDQSTHWADFMNVSGNFQYTSNDDFTAVDLPYGGKLRFEGTTSPASDPIGLGNDEEGVSNMLFLEFIDAEEESEFDANDGGPIACRIREAKGPPIEGASVFTGGYTLNARWILADSCRAVEPEATHR